jgi:hypothetical protein
MSARLPRRGPHRRAVRRAGARLCRLAAVLAGLTCALLASAAVPAAFATSPPAYGPPGILLGAGAPGPCSEVCSGGGYGLGGPSSRTPGDSSAGNTARTLPQRRVVTGSAGFHGGDAGIGAGGMLAWIVIGLGRAFTLTHRRNHRIHGQCSTLLGRLWAAQSASARGAAGPSRRSPRRGPRSWHRCPPGTDLIAW